jgi:hypothetical protein
MTETPRAPLAYTDAAPAEDSREDVLRCGSCTQSFVQGGSVHSVNLEDAICGGRRPILDHGAPAVDRHLMTYLIACKLMWVLG